MSIHNKSTEFGIAFLYSWGLPLRIEQNTKVYYTTTGLLVFFHAGVIKFQLYRLLVTQKKRKNMNNSAKLFQKMMDLFSSAIGTFPHSCTLRAVSMISVTQMGILISTARF